MSITITVTLLTFDSSGLILAIIFLSSLYLKLHWDANTCDPLSLRTNGSEEQGLLEISPSTDTSNLQLSF